MKRTVVTVSTVNSAIARAGIRAELVRGNGYFYFTGEAVRYCRATSVMVYKASQLSEAQWFDELRTMADESETRRLEAEAHETQFRG